MVFLLQGNTTKILTRIPRDPVSGLSGSAHYIKTKLNQKNGTKFTEFNLIALRTAVLAVLSAIGLNIPEE